MVRRASNRGQACPTNKPHIPLRHINPSMNLSNLLTDPHPLQLEPLDIASRQRLPDSCPYRALPHSVRIQQSPLVLHHLSLIPLRPMLPKSTPHHHLRPSHTHLWLCLTPCLPRRVITTTIVGLGPFRPLTLSITPLCPCLLLRQSPRHLLLFHTETIPPVLRFQPPILRAHFLQVRVLEGPDHYLYHRVPVSTTYLRPLVSLSVTTVPQG